MSNQESIQGRYDALLNRAKILNLRSGVIEKASYWQSKGWHVYFDYVVRHIPVSPQGKVVLDFGCGHGLLSPILLDLGAERVIGLDVIPDLAAVRTLFEGSPVDFIEPEAGYVPLQPETVDIAVMNEVISHVPIEHLPVVYNEMWRVLRHGGVLFISDGNGIHSATYEARTLQPLYAALENGPDGTTVGGPPFPVTVQRSFLNQRADLIRKWHPELKADVVDCLARNTSGLHTDFLRRTVDRFLETGELIRRPYQPGFVATVPTTGGVEERGFYPQQVAFDLMARGFSTRTDPQGNRNTAPWSGPLLSCSFPDGNFFVVATKP